MNKLEKQTNQGIQKDTQALIIFYGIIFLSIALFFYFADIKNQKQIIVNNIFLGFTWAGMGIYNARKLQKIYAKSFWQLQIREQKYITISLLVAAFGSFMLIWKSLQWLNR